MDSAQVAPAYTFPKGKPVVLLISTKDDVAFGKVYERLRGEFGKRIRFIKLDPGTKVGQDAAKEFSVEKPTWVLADSKGQVVEKIDGAFTNIEMSSKLNALAKGR